MKRFFVQFQTAALCTLMFVGATGILNAAQDAAALQAVAYLGQNDRVVELLKNDLSPQALAEGLCSAIEGGHTATARLIMAKNPDYTVCSTSFLHSAVGSAVKEGNTEILNLLIAAGAPVNIPSTGSYGETPLHLAAAAGRADHVRMLLSAGADVNAVGGFGKTPLASVCFNMDSNKQNYNQIVRMLLDAGADPNIEHPVLRQPFLMAAILQNNVSLVRILLESGKVSQDIKDSMLRFVATEPGFSPEIAAALLAAGANPDSKSQQTFTALDYAFHHDNATVLKHILNALRLPDHSIKKIFADSVFKNKPACCRVLLNSYPTICNTSLTDPKTGNTPLRAAVRKGHAEIIKVLVAAGANLDIKNIAGETPRDLAAGKQELLVALATPQRPDSAELHTAIKAKNSAAVQRLIDAGVDVTAKDAEGDSPLMRAVYAQNPEIVKMLLTTPLCDVNEVPLKGITPLICSIVAKNKEIAELLLKHGANPNQADKAGITPLSYAEEDTACLDLLIEHGVDINAVNATGRTELLMQTSVVSHLNLDYTQKLLAAGANPNVTNSSGDTPLHQLVRSDHCPKELIPTLVNAGADMQKKNKAGESPIDLATKYNPALLAILAPHFESQSEAPSSASLTPSQPTPTTKSTDTQTGETSSTPTSQVQGSSSSSSTEPQPTPTPPQSDPKNTPHKGRDIIDLDIPFNDSQVPRHSKNTAEIKNLVDKMNDNQPTDLTPLVMPTVLIAGTVSGYKGYQAFKKEKTEIIARNKILPAEQRILEAKITQAALRATVKKHPWLAGIFAASLLGGAVDIAYRLS